MKKIVIAAGLILTAQAQGAIETLSQAHLIRSNQYYTDTIGGGLGDVIVGRTDDGSSAVQSLGFNFTFYGQTYDSIYINNNGNVTFGWASSQYTPSSVAGSYQASISPFFADVDTRPVNGGQVYLRREADQVFVTWDQVGYYNQRTDKLNSFQLVLRADDASVAADEGRIGFFYKSMGWETGAASGGQDGFGGLEAAVGLSDGRGNGAALYGSTEAGIASAVGNSHLWLTVRPDSTASVTLTVAPVPEPETYALIGVGLAAIGFARRRRGVMG